MLRKRIKIAVYERTLELIITKDFLPEYRRIEKRHKIVVDLDTDTQGCYISGKGGMHYLIIHKDCLTYNTIAHEIFHAANGILDRICIEDEEAKAWLCGYLTDRVLSHLAKKKIKIKHGPTR